jgi:hypothetical protein
MPGSATSVRRNLAARKAALSRSRTADDSEYVAVCRELEYQRLTEHAARVIADWPNPTEDQLERIAALLRTGGDAA